MRYLINFLFILVATVCFSQNQFHVFPSDGEKTRGNPNGDGSLSKPWDLQTALSQPSERLNGGDIIWIHQGVYNGRFRSMLKSTITNSYITVSAYEQDKVILNGNVDEKNGYVLDINGGGVIYKNFEITFLGEFSRSRQDVNFNVVTGVNHTKGENCKFQNLVIHNIPGSGIGSWKATANSVIEDCIIYNNGYEGGRGHGVGIYVQNQSDDIRLIRNNIIFNNYYKGIEVWSATSGSKFQFIKNVTLLDNIIFNNGVPYGKNVDNIIIASNDTDGINVAKDIKVLNNVLYHNV
ncbi:MAG: right-handed parallel beta-helix repeat-containing protein, partial [Winogradskyella sp.]|nr:right-handed parallel beta-helix repeat-containing protein [Winogradskyella sp.]